MSIEYPLIRDLKKDAGLNFNKESTTRRKLWQLPGSFHCLVVGTCLKLSEAEALCKKCGFSVVGKSDYELHRFIVGQAGYADSIVARRAHKLLESKYKVDIARLRGRQATSTLLEQWNIMRDSGRIAGALWATVTHPNSNSEVVDKVYGEVHMLSHLAGASTHKQAEALPNAQREIKTLQTKLKNQQSVMNEKIRDGLERIERLEKLNAELKLKLRDPAALQTELTAINERAHEIVKSALRDTNGKLREIRVKLNNVEAECEKRNEDNIQLTQDNEELERLIENLTQRNAKPGGQCSKSLSGKCLLLLGGKPSQCRHFKAYVEANSGDFLHHDGGIESNISRIDKLISQADAVLCPVEQISHSAMLRAKKVCKSTDKPLVFLPKSSLTAFVSGIREIT